MNLKKIVLSLRIRAKLLVAFGSILLMSVVLIALSIISINRIIAYKDVNEQVDILKLHLESIDLATKEFIYEGYKSKTFLENQHDASIDKFNSSIHDSKAIIKSISGSKLMEGENTLQLTRMLTASLDSIQTEFSALIALLKARGFKDFGLEGSLRKAIHIVENSSYPFNKVAMLTLRRHEKDFFLRRDLKYQKEFNARLDEFVTELQLQRAPADLLKNIDEYKAQFNSVVEIESKIGLTQQEGIKGKILQNFARVKPQIEIFRTAVKEKNGLQILRTQITLFIVFFGQIITGLVLAIVYANLLTKSIKEIRTAMQALANGFFPEKLAVRTSEEIGQTKEAFNQFIDRLKIATDFAERMGTGDLTAVYDKRFSNDVLAQSIISMQRKLKEADDRQYRINWINQGSAQFNDILKNESEAVEVLGDKILKHLVAYVGANQGALYIAQEDQGENYLERIATYAYGKKKFEMHRIGIREGLMGQCVMEQSTIHLKELPRDYIKITSGLGEATPRSVVMVPLKVRDKIMGVIEMASFENFEQYKIEFIEKTAEHIAAILFNKQAVLITEKMLMESREQANTLRQQEEEMRQNAEELQATQEAMERQRQELQDEIKHLRQQLAKMESEYA
ncbi:MAG TPA: GAF domain-containing protein [Ohtaekwangia sp.]|uniref:GAF domain-containing protein n=1 Tax=Ohtaekwangia sp. TaxID=2066019 RepID=UPI002F9339B5